jgi:hypothetical protein
LVGSVVKILTEHLDLRSKKKTKEGLFSENECICQDNLALIWKSNAARMNKLMPQLKHIMSIYLLHSQRSVNETGMKFLVDLVKSLVENEQQYCRLVTPRKSLQHQKDLLMSVISYTDNDKNAKILDPFFSEMILFFETTSKELSEETWVELLKVFNHAMESKAIGPKEFEKSTLLLNNSL